MSDPTDYNNEPAYIAVSLREWFEANKTRNGFWRRVALWRFGCSWKSTEWNYPTLHSITTEWFPYDPDTPRSP